ncbi:MAG: 2OG-Fe(II) oxygenase [Gammaproteobacteria bacterium]|nr:2OG-Fe(II) oxygenase [Gammaproteobacteria bacterium]
MDWAVYWHKYFDGHADALDRLVDDGFAIIDHALPQDLYHQLVQASQDPAHYQAAKITTGGRLETVRSDSTRWIDHQDEVGRQYLAVLQGVGEVLNQSLYLGIRSVEAHYAQYQIGQFYAQHSDNAKGSNIRAISTVLYLNSPMDDLPVNNIWQAEWGGQLRLEDLHQSKHDILPLANRLVVFQSDLPHEVLPATQVRRSIAGWLRRDERV